MRSKLTLILLVFITLATTFVLYKFTIHNKINSDTSTIKSYSSTIKPYNPTVKSEFSIGVNIHFIQPNIEEVNKIHEAGFNVIRMDLGWKDIEKQKGVYDFSQYDKLVKSMNESNIKILFILDYSNPLYDNNLSPYSDNGKKAFANFAKQAVGHYKDKMILWEIWNEPNDGFWKPQQNSYDYYKLAIETIRAIRSMDKNAFIIAPALSKFDYSFLNSLGQAGLFKYINAISVHPYRQDNPETVIDDYKRLRELIQNYPHNENIEVFADEWGYSTSWSGINDMKQAQYCIRAYLTNIMSGINLSVWYDWKDDDTNKNYDEHNFGTVYNDLTPKPTYYAIKTMNTIINGYKYLKRLDIGSKDDYVLMFGRGTDIVYALWTTNKNHAISIDLKGNTVEIIELMGNNYKIKATSKKYSVSISDNVKYILNY